MSSLKWDAVDLNFPLPEAELAELVHRIAVSMARGGSSHDREDFGMQVVLEMYGTAKRVPLFSGYDRTRRKLIPWLKKVCKNRWIDFLRDSQRRAKLVARAAQQFRENPVVAEFRIKRAETALFVPFSETDLARISQWSVLHRIEVLLVHNCWQKVPEDLWEAWLREYECERNVQLPRPCPPKLESTLQGDRFILARATEWLDRPRKALSGSLKSGIELFRNLEFIRNINETMTGSDRDQ